jgi:hypothetical protein
MKRQIFLVFLTIFLVLGVCAFAQLQDLPEDIELPEDIDIIDEYTIVPGDTLVRIANERWGNYRLWPALYLVNRDKVEDPYRIEPGMTLRIPTRVEPEMLNQATRKILNDAYADIYTKFQNYGASYRYPARWILLEASYFDPDFVQEYADAITEDDRLWYYGRSGE